jgi:hypothetical protein
MKLDAQLKVHYFNDASVNAIFSCTRATQICSHAGFKIQNSSLCELFGCVVLVIGNVWPPLDLAPENIHVQRNRYIHFPQQNSQYAQGGSIGSTKTTPRSLILLLWHIDQLLGNGPRATMEILLEIVFSMGPAPRLYYSTDRADEVSAVHCSAV